MTDWHELSIEGPAAALDGFIAGYEAGIGRRLGLVRGRDLDLARESLIERLRDTFFTSDAHHLVFAQSDAADALEEAIHRQGGAVRLEILHHRRVENATFSFTAEVFAEELAKRIRSEIEGSLPEGVSLEDLEVEEEREPDAKGTELYAPAHDYRFAIRGRLSGPFPGVLEMHRRAAAFDFVSVRPLEIRAADLRG